MAYDEIERIKRSAYTRTKESTKRNYISSGNFKKSTSFQVFHNANVRPDYAIGGELVFDLGGYEALELKNKIVSEAKEAYEKNKSSKAPKFKAKSYEWSLVVNIKPDTSINDLQELSKHFQEKYGFQCYQIAIHRDEGHFNEQGEKLINHHAHMEFITLDKETGKNNFRREKITPKVLREIQTEIAEILGMERGEDKRISGAKRIEPRAYAVLKEKEKREKKKNINLEQEQEKEQFLNKSEYKKIIEDFRKSQINQGLDKDFFKELSELKKNFQEIKEDNLSELLNDILREHLERIEKLKKENSILKAENELLKQKEQKNDKSQGLFEFIENLAIFRLNEALNKIYSKPLKKILEAETEVKKKERVKILTETMEKTKTHIPETLEKWIENNKDFDLKEILMTYQNSPSKELKQSIYKGR
ncbi:mobilization protein [Campylobacter jejuni]|uniref:mobilization protein n=1 Tax=Campylobacter jejuni TaxID=197 RepID=UPI00087419AC|nr:mobilization protein [Campylobacter jejuni]EKQ1039958.1 mobilization protein [Campylobacter jejuni]OEV51875.1 mobilization protein [Campylobacter jejuni]OEV57225.1 mobilization protein [Campylobacter jejuni]OEV61965.1 mobilization protein [Campylobacter jejuni]OEV67448.1 mobilization protein [Campylobacter jejuni]